MRYAPDARQADDTVLIGGVFLSCSAMLSATRKKGALRLLDGLVLKQRLERWTPTM